MKNILLILFMLLTGFTFGQTKESQIYAEVEQMADFPGGTLVFRQLISENFREKKVNGKGKEFCQLTFVIDRDGSITDIKAVGENESFNKEAIRAISKIKTKWIPAKVNNIRVRCRFRIPLNLDFS